MDERSPPAPMKRISSLKQFWRTKKAIAEGQPLYDWKNAELKTANYLPPIPFNIMESLLAALPGMAVMLVLFLLVQPGLTEGADPLLDKGVLYRNLALFCVLLGLYLLIPPIFTGILAPFAGAGSIRIEDRTPLLKRRATRAYLFLDGTFGLYTQSTIALCWILSIWIGMNEMNPLFILVVSLTLIAAGFHQLYLSFSKIPKRLFQINGYSVRIRRFWQKKQADDPPWNRYQLYYVGGGFISGLFLGMVISAFETVIMGLMN